MADRVVFQVFEVDFEPVTPFQSLWERSRNPVLFIADALFAALEIQAAKRAENEAKTEKIGEKWSESVTMDQKNRRNILWKLENQQEMVIDNQELIEQSSW